MATNRTLGIVAALALVLGTGGGAAAGWMVAQATTSAVGATGAQGAPGQNGEPGAPGQDGVDGATGTPGTPGSPGARGAAGDRGPQGTPGAPGAPGVAGPAGATGPVGVSGLDGVVEYAYVPLSNMTLAAHSGSNPGPAGTITGTISFSQEGPWIVDTPGLYRVTLSANTQFAASGVQYAMARISVGPAPIGFGTSSTTAALTEAQAGGDHATLHAVFVGQINAGDELEAMLDTYASGVTFTDAYLLFELLG